MRYVSIGSPEIKEAEFDRFGSKQLPTFVLSTLFGDRHRPYWFEPAGKQTVHTAKPLGLRPGLGQNWDTRRAAIAANQPFFAMLYTGVTTGDAKPDHTASAARGIGRALRTIAHNIGQPTRAGSEPSEEEDAKTLDAIADRIQRDKDTSRLVAASLFMHTPELNEVALLASTSQGGASYVGSEVHFGVFEGFALVTKGRCEEGFFNLEPGSVLEPLVSHPTSGTIGLFPAGMNISGILYDAQTVREALQA